LTEKELHVAEWAFLHRQASGQFTDNLPGSSALHLPLATERAVLGVLSLSLPDRTLTLAQRDLLEAYARQAALVLDRVALRAAAEQSKLVAESERLSNALLNSISHELRTPLAAISSVASGLRAAGSLSPAQKSLIEELSEAAGRLNRVVQNLLDLSRLESGHLRPNLDWHDLRDVIQAALQNLGRALEQHKVKIEIPPDLPPVKLDAALTEQMLVNLLGNAGLHTPVGTVIDLRIRSEPGQLVLEVADNGPGLPADDPMRLFDRFQRGPNAAAGGTGLGLSLVKGFTEAQGGTVRAENRPGGGALFTVKLPLTIMPPVPEEKT
jgi:two-component system sensor histidine kinase KdpD